MSKMKIDLFEKIILFLVIIIGIALISYSAIVIRNAHNLRIERNEIDSLYIKKYLSLQNNLLISEPNYQYDSIITKIIANQIDIIKEQDTLVNDLRQETNSNIDKINALLSFWVGIIALLGVFIPIALQFKLRADSNERMNVIEKRFHKIKKDIHKWSILQNKEIKYHSHIYTLNSICINAEHKISLELGNYESISQGIWDNAIENFKEIVTVIFSQEENNKNRYILIDSLIHTAVALDKINRSASRSQTRHRSITNAQDSVSRIITIIHSKNYPSWVSLHTTMQSLLQQLSIIDFYSLEK